MYLIAACLVAMPPLVSHLLPQKLKDATTSFFTRSSRTTKGKVSHHISNREAAVELGAFDVSRVRPDGFKELRYSNSQEPLKAEGGATADVHDNNDIRTVEGWPPKEEFDKAVHVKKEIWVTASSNV